MFNRALQVKMVKTEKETTTQPNPEDVLEKKLAVISRSFENMALKVGKAVIAYVVADTVRQILVAKATRS